MLSTPNYGLAISSFQCLKYEIAIGNAVIDNMKDVHPVSHIDIVYWLEDTLKNTLHCLQVSIFQRKTQ